MSIPHAASLLPRWVALRRRAGRLFVALDFDGTLAPIVPEPEAAAMPPEARAALAQLARRADTVVAIVSGRALDDVRRRAGAQDILFAGNHGLEIEGPGVVWRHAAAAAQRGRLDACAAALEAELADLDGVWVEHKGLTLSVHYRRAADPNAGTIVEDAARRACGGAGLRTAPGKKVVNVLPDVDWDKGDAVRTLLDRVDPVGERGVWCIFIGDDRTDEDAFRAIDGRGDGVLVAERPPPDTAAHAYVENVEGVAALLRGLAA